MRPRARGEKAFLRNANHEHRVPGSYFVFLRPGYTLEHHKAAIESTVDLDQHALRVFERTIPGPIFYYVDDLEEDALDAIRLDIGVQMVECNYKLILV